MISYTFKLLVFYTNRGEEGKEVWRDAEVFKVLVLMQRQEVLIQFRLG